MPRWLWWSPVLLVTLLLAVQGLRLGWIYATMSEMDVINAFAGKYLETRAKLGDQAATRMDCHAVPGIQDRVWITVSCTAADGSLYVYPADRFGRLVDLPQAGGART